MKSIAIQFHATTEELLEYVVSVSVEHGLVITMMVLKPFSLTTLDSEPSLGEITDKLQQGDLRLVLNTENPNNDVISPNKFLDANPGSILIDVGTLSDSGLKESALSFMSDQKDKVLIAGKLASKLKKLTKAGAIAVNPVTGAEANIRSHRYTNGAKLMFNEGVKILPIAGNSLYKLPD